jgi:hypothetical protein
MVFYTKTVNPTTASVNYKEATDKELLDHYKSRYPSLALQLLNDCPSLIVKLGYVIPKKTDCKTCYYSDKCKKLDKINAHCFDWFGKINPMKFGLVKEAKK